MAEHTKSGTNDITKNEQNSRPRKELLQGNSVVAQALTGSGEEDTLVYQQLFEAAGQAMGQARFDLYDLEGRWRYSPDPQGERNRPLSPEVLAQTANGLADGQPARPPERAGRCIPASSNG